MLKEPKRRIGLEARRSLIVEAATQVFAEQGYQGASLREIARRADVTKAVLYDHFASKRELHLWLLERQRDELFGHVARRLGDGEVGGAEVAAAVDAFLHWAETNPGAWRMLFRDTGGEPEIADAHRRLQAEAAEATAAMLLQRTAADADDHTVAMVGQLLQGAIHGLARGWHDHPEVPRDQVVAACMDVVWVGLERARHGQHWAGTG